MKKEHTSFITGLLSNPKLSSDQRDKVVELAVRDLSKNGSEARILQDLEWIKEKLEIMPQETYDISTEPIVIKRFNTPDMTEKEILGFKEQLSTEEYERYFGENQKVKSSKIAKKNTEESQPIEKRFTAEEFVERQLEKLTDPDLVLKNKKAEKKNITSKKSLPDYRNPKLLSAFLQEYSQNPILSYTCHNIDDEKVIQTIIKLTGGDSYNFEKHLNLIISEYKKLSGKYYGKLGDITSLIYTYLTGHNPDGWTRIKINWSSVELKEWSKDNPGIVPNPGPNLSYNGYEFMPIEVPLQERTLFLFKDLVIYFKYLFHIRLENSLKYVLTYFNSYTQLNKKCNINLQGVNEKIQFFTDVSKLIQAYSKIINLCTTFAKDNKKPKPEIFLSLTEDQDYIFFEIHHKNSIYGKSLQSSIRCLGEAQRSLINNQINGLCDLYLEADFDYDEYGRISIWPWKPTFVPIDRMTGVKYILKLYR